MQVNIDKKAGFRVAGKAYTLDSKDQAKNIRKEFLEEFTSDDLKDLGSFCALRLYNAKDDNYNYFLGFEIADNDFIENHDLEIKEVEESLYLEVPVEGEGGLDKAYEYTYEEFFPNKKYFHSLGPDIEFYQYDHKKKAVGNVSLFIAVMKNPHIDKDQ